MDYDELGFSGSNTNEGEYWRFTLRWDQLIKNTDIVLLAPDGTDTSFNATTGKGLGRNSYIKTPNSAEDEKTAYSTAFYNTYVDSITKSFHPTEKIIGGTIYVGSGQTLTIEKNINADNSVMVKPNKIIVDGGNLFIRASTLINVESPIYVKNEGKLILENGAHIKGDVHVYDNGSFEIIRASGDGTGATVSVTIDAPSPTTSVPTIDTEEHGVFIYGTSGSDDSAEDAAVKNGWFTNISANGFIDKITLNGGGINVYAPKIHMIEDSFTLNVNTQWNTGTPTPYTSDAIWNNSLCIDRNIDKNLLYPYTPIGDTNPTGLNANRCNHYGSIGQTSRWSDVSIWKED
jgi:hypothetical protein